MSPLPLIWHCGPAALITPNQPIDPGCYPTTVPATSPATSPNGSMTATSNTFAARPSLSRPMSSVALITSYRRRLALLTCHTGLSLLFEVGARPPHDGLRRMGRPNLSGALAAD